MTLVHAFFFFFALGTEVYMYCCQIAAVHPHLQFAVQKIVQGVEAVKTFFF